MFGTACKYCFTASATSGVATNKELIFSNLSFKSALMVRNVPTFVHINTVSTVCVLSEAPMAVRQFSVCKGTIVGHMWWKYIIINRFIIRCQINLSIWKTSDFLQDITAYITSSLPQCKHVFLWNSVWCTQHMKPNTFPELLWECRIELVAKKLDCHRVYIPS